MRSAYSYNPVCSYKRRISLLIHTLVVIYAGLLCFVLIKLSGVNIPQKYRKEKGIICFL